MRVSKKAFISLLFIVPFILISYKLFTENKTLKEVKYILKECDIGLNEYKDSLKYDKINKTLEVNVVTNCCGINITINKSGKTYFIYEKQYGTLCRCICLQKVNIFDAESDSKIIFVTIDNRKKILSPNLEFCGISTYSECNSNEDCIKSGCSNQICQSKYEEPIATTCEFRECYDVNKFKVDCKCIDNKCQWE